MEALRVFADVCELQTFHSWNFDIAVLRLMNVREITVVVKSSIWGDLTRFSLSEHQLMEFCLKQDGE